jgi:hypothetical protein
LLIYGPYRPLGPQREPLMTAHDGWVLHTMVGTLTTTERFFGLVNGPGYEGTESTWGVGGPWGETRDGELVCWQDLTRQADAQRAGGARLWSIECADGGVARPLTGAQVETIARLVAVTSRPEFHASCPPGWACRAGIPIVDLRDSRPGRRGFGIHRHGIDPWRVPDGEVWGGRGKTCPHDERIRQVPQILARAREIRDQLDTPPTPPTAAAHRGDPVFFVRIATQAPVWVSNGQTRRYVPDPATLGRLQGLASLGLTGQALADARTVWTVKDEAELNALAGLHILELDDDPAPGIDLDALAGLVVERQADDLAARVADELADRLDS